MKKHFTVSGLLICAGLVQAHESHGLASGLQGQTGDALALIVLAALAGAGLWLARAK